MTPFREWGIGEPFEVLAGITTRFGVKLDPDTVEPKNLPEGERKSIAFMLDTNTIEHINHNKNVSSPQTPDGGRLARTHDNRLIVVREAGNGIFGGYYVNLTGYVVLQKAEFRLLSIESGERREEVSITLNVISETTDKLNKSIEFLKLCLLE